MTLRLPCSAPSGAPPNHPVGVTCRRVFASSDARVSSGVPWGRARAVSTLLLALACALAAGTARAAPRLRELAQYLDSDAARIVSYLTRPAPFELTESPFDPAAHDPPDTGWKKVELKIPSELGIAPIDPMPLSGLVRALRVTSAADHVEIALLVPTDAQASAFFLPDPYRVVLDVARPRPVTSPPEPSTGSPRRVRRVAIDPGHGGEDPGAVGAAGLREKDVVLDIAHRAAALVARDLGASAILTRDGDVRVPLEQRVAKANAFGADLFVSIHCNAARRQSAEGFMSFVLDGRSDEAAREREHGQRLVVSRRDSFLRQFRLRGERVERSHHFAQLLQRATGVSLRVMNPGARDGGVHSAGFYVLAGARMPAVLFETAFVSNPREEALLGQTRYRQKLADAIVNAIRAYAMGL